jgi:tetratricopeptide (TPR) repeat protein
MKKLSLIILVIVILLTPARCLAVEAGYSGTKDEIKLAELLSQRKYIKARELAEKMLAIDSSSYAANYAMGFIISTAETNLPKAYFYLQRAKDSYEGRHGKMAGDEKTWRWHVNILLQLIHTSAGMELFEKQLEYLKAHDAAYIPKKTSFYAWPLMKMGRISESRRLIQKALKESKDEFSKAVALNTLGAIELELDNRDESYRVYKELVTSVNYKKGYVVEKHNLASAALALHKFDEAEKVLIESAAEGCTPYEVSNPWDSLAYIYTMEGRFNEAYGALRKMIQWGLEREAYLDQQCIAGENGTKALFMLACGYPEQAWIISKKLVDRPDRQGFSSSKKYTNEGGIILFYMIALDDYIKVLQERLVWASPVEKAGIIWNIKTLESERILLKSRLKSTILNNNALNPTLIPSHPNGIHIAEFLKPYLLGIVGTGLVSAEIGNIRRSYKYKDLADPYLLEMEGELAYNARNNKKALSCFLEAQEKLPPAEKLLNARIYALTGKVKENLGDLDSAMPLYQKAYQIYPALFRELSIRLPVTISSESGEPSIDEIRKNLRKSPRFRLREGAFRIDVGMTGNRITGNLLDNFGNRVFTVSTVKTGNKQKDASLFLDEFHIKAFSAPISASLSDINSLDGSNIKDDQMREGIRDILFDRKSRKK